MEIKTDMITLKTKEHNTPRGKGFVTTASMSNDQGVNFTSPPQYFREPSMKANAEHQAKKLLLEMMK